MRLSDIPRRHQLTNGLEHRFELAVVLALERVEFPCEPDVRLEHPPQFDEGAHDLHVDDDGPLAAQHTGQHGHALLSEDKGLRPTAAP